MRPRTRERNIIVGGQSLWGGREKKTSVDDNERLVYGEVTVKNECIHFQS
jgi:hypothetical protein